MKKYQSGLRNRRLSLLLAFMLISCNFVFCARASNPDLNPTADSASELADLPEDSLPEVDPDEDYVVRYTDQAVGTDSNEGDHWTQLDGEELEAALEDGTVAYYEEDAMVTLLGDSDSQWEHAAIHLEEMEEIDADGSGIVIGVIDSGVYPHTELKNCLLPGYNYIDDNEDTTDTYGHGTKVAGILAAACDGSGISGAAPGAKLVPLKAFDNRQTSISNLIAAIYGAVDTYHCDIINMSFGTTTVSSALEHTINYAAEQGVILVAAVGNDGKATMQYPAGYDEVIGVGSISQDGSIAASSQRNASVFIAAPGVLVSTTTITDSYETVSGTSFSTPLVTGAIADLLSAEPTLTAEQLRTLLSETAQDAGTEGYDTNYGWGILDLRAARAALLNDASVYLAPLTTVESGSLSVSLTRLSGAATEYSLVVAVQSSDGTLTSVSTSDFMLDESGKLNSTVSIPSDIEEDSLLPQSFTPIASRQLSLADDSSITVYAVESELYFQDVNHGIYYYNPVGWAVTNGITLGTGHQLFSPDACCTRAQIVTFLWRAAGEPEPKSAVSCFADVTDPSQYYYKAVLWGAENGIVLGTSSTTFSPLDECTRAQAVTFLWRYAGSPEASETSCPFTDVSPEEYYYTAVLWASEQGITYGTGDTCFSPDIVCSRAEIVTFVYRMLNMQE